MQVGEYRVGIVQSMADPLAQAIEVYVMLRTATGMAVLRNGVWHEVPEDTAPEGPTLSLPRPALEALIDEVDRFRGAPSHVKTEAAVLREWLAAEQKRVDRFMDKAFEPISFVSPPGVTIPNKR